MPKVSDEYFENKKRFIVDAAYKVCLKKPAQMVTMTDVIEETHLSQGGIYRFYKDLDEILSDMVTGMRSKYNFIDGIDKIFKEGEELSFEEAVRKVCAVLSDTMEEHLLDIQKINFDLTVLAINDPERADRIIGNIKGRGNFEYLARVAFPLLNEASKKHDLKPKGSPKELYDFISSAYTGIELNCILSACYGNGLLNLNVSPKPLFETLAKTIIFLFGGNTDE
ncbi:MAG: TetR/AcrR family transcriptional regulator [Lachnospiraceae bacterium]|nr:TetR/AcrR family transcriptional regulator [Lachnospiraceae bacterium]